MIKEYHRPRTVEEAAQLLSRPAPRTVPMGGGTVLNRPGGEDLALVDLQDLHLAEIRLDGNTLVIGATATLQSVLESPLPAPALQAAVRQEASLHIRQAGTMAGTLAAAGGRSPAAAVCLALDARLTWAPGSQTSLLSEMYALDHPSSGLFITAVTLPANCQVAYHAASRTPADWPLVCAAAARWPSGRVRLVLGGFGSRPVMVLDGKDASGGVEAARDAYSEAGDAWASAAYRSEIAAVLAGRCLKDLEAA